MVHFSNYSDSKFCIFLFELITPTYVVQFMFKIIVENFLFKIFTYPVFDIVISTLRNVLSSDTMKSTQKLDFVRGDQWYN